jgi:hypothetical protein
LFADTGPGVAGEYRLGDEVVEFSARRIVTDVEVDGATRIETYRDAEAGDLVFQMEADFYDVARMIRVTRIGDRVDRMVDGESVPSPADWDKALALIGEAAAALETYEGEIPNREHDVFVEFAATLSDAGPGAGAFPAPRPEPTYHMDCEAKTDKPTFDKPYYVTTQGEVECIIPEGELDRGYAFTFWARSLKSPTWRHRWEHMQRIEHMYDELTDVEPGEKVSMSNMTLVSICPRVGWHKFMLFIYDTHGIGMKSLGHSEGTFGYCE